jgi:predicted nucleic acid-binding protein
MNGIKCLFDTNAIIALLKGNSSLDNLTDKADLIITSVINVIEFFYYFKLSEPDKEILMN